MDNQVRLTTHESRHTEATHEWTELARMWAEWLKRTALQTLGGGTGCQLVQQHGHV